MRRSIMVAAFLLTACAKAEKPPAADAAPPAPPQASVTVADFTGTWKMQTRREGTDSVLVRFDLVAGSTENDWSLRFEGRDPVPMRVVAIGGDSVVSEAGPYASAVRKGKQVTTRTTLRLDGQTLKGMTVATYDSGPDSVLNLVTEGTR